MGGKGFVFLLKYPLLVSNKQLPLECKVALLPPVKQVRAIFIGIFYISSSYKINIREDIPFALKKCWY